MRSKSKSCGRDGGGEESGGKKKRCVVGNGNEDGMNEDRIPERNTTKD